MWTYIIQRCLVMIPTLFGVTVVSFVVMQLAPGDPMLNQLSAGGSQGNTGTREAYLIQKRELRLNKPLLLNFNDFKNYDERVRNCAYYFGRTQDEIVDDLRQLSSSDLTRDQQSRFEFLHTLGIDELDTRIYGLSLGADAPDSKRVELWSSLAIAIHVAVQIACEDMDDHAVTPAIGILKSDADLTLKIGAIKCLQHCTVDPFRFNYGRPAEDSQTPRVVSTWRAWWDRNQQEFSDEQDAARREEVIAGIAELEGDPDYRKRLYAMINEEYFEDDIPYFMEVLLGDSTLQEKEIAALALSGLVEQMLGRAPLERDVKRDASPEMVARVADNWIEAFYNPLADQFQPALPAKLWSVIADTQYAHMVWRLVTFDFGTAARKSREKVSDLIWDAFLVSAPLMLMAELVIYFVAVPIGIICAVHRGKFLDRAISIALFLLYSVPAFVAAMLLLMLFCYGDYLKWFPMDGLHSPDAHTLGFFAYWLDYLWHCVLPVLCLSLFSLAGLAMYSRASMLDVIGQDYVRTARAKGCSERRVVFHHALRNALVPILTLFSNFLPALLGGSILIEVLFGIPGLGRLGWAAIEQKDFPTLMALLYIDSLVVLVSILLTDLLYVVVDPRISFQRQGGDG